MSPVERCTTPNVSLMTSHCVPLPLAGAPDMINLTGPVASFEEAAIPSRKLFLMEEASSPNMTRLLDAVASDVRVTPHADAKETAGCVGAMGTKAAAPLSKMARERKL